MVVNLGNPAQFHQQFVYRCDAERVRKVMQSFFAFFARILCAFA
jgi:hypothetical protein